MIVSMSMLARADQAHRPVLRAPFGHPIWFQSAFNQRLFRRAEIPHGRSAASISEPQTLSKGGPRMTVSTSMFSRADQAHRPVLLAPCAIQFGFKIGVQSAAVWASRDSSQPLVFSTGRG